MRRVFNRTWLGYLSAMCLGASAITLGRALEIFNGFFHPDALNWLTAALVLCLIGVIAHRFVRGLSNAGVVAVSALLTAGIAWQIEQMLVAKSPGMYIKDTVRMWPFYTGVILQGGLIAAGVAGVPAMRRIWFPAVLAVSLAIGVWMIKASPNPYIDVVTVHKEALDAFLHHRDPYRISFENIYGADSGLYYNPAAVIGKRLAIAYPYPPASLIFAVPGHFLFGDFRYSELAWLILGAGLIGFSRTSLSAKLAACLLLTTPRVWFVIEQGWTEPIAIFMLALTVFLLIRNPIWASWAAGILIVTKQYLGFTGLALLRLVWLRPSKWYWILFGMGFAAAAITLPLALWHPNAFMRNVVWLQTQEPFRVDSLSYLSWAARRGMGQGTFMWAIGAAIAAAVVSVVVTRNTAGGFAAAVALTTFMMFAFGSKAFCNYYFFVIGALCCTLAAFDTLADRERAVQTSGTPATG